MKPGATWRMKSRKGRKSFATIRLRHGEKFDNDDIADVIINNTGGTDNVDTAKETMEEIRELPKNMSDKKAIRYVTLLSVYFFTKSVNKTQMCHCSLCVGSLRLSTKLLNVSLLSVCRLLEVGCQGNCQRCHCCLCVGSSSLSVKETVKGVTAVCVSASWGCLSRNLSKVSLLSVCQLHGVVCQGNCQRCHCCLCVSSMGLSVKEPVKYVL